MKYLGKKLRLLALTKRKAASGDENAFGRNRYRGSELCFQWLTFLFFLAAVIGQSSQGAVLILLRVKKSGLKTTANGALGVYIEIPFYTSILNHVIAEVVCCKRKKIISLDSLPIEIFSTIMSLLDISEFGGESKPKLKTQALRFAVFLPILNKFSYRYLHFLYVQLYKLKSSLSKYATY